MYNKVIIMIVLVVAISINGCANTAINPTNAIIKQPTYYANEGYSLREAGADWIMVSIIPLAYSQLQISVKSRDDIKKPTCTYSSTAHLNPKTGDYEANEKGQNITFIFSDNQLEINSTDTNLLHYFCSGGATLKGTYQQVN